MVYTDTLSLFASAVVSKVAPVLEEPRPVLSSFARTSLEKPLSSIQTDDMEEG